MMPTQESFEGGDLVGSKIDERLVVNLEFIVEQGISQVQLELSSLLHARVHFRLKEPVGPTTIRLRAVQGHVRVLQQLIGFEAVNRSDRDSNADVDDDLVAVQLIGFGDRVAYSP